MTRDAFMYPKNYDYEDDKFFVAELDEGYCRPKTFRKIAETSNMGDALFLARRKEISSLIHRIRRFLEETGFEAEKASPLISDILKLDNLLLPEGTPF